MNYARRAYNASKHLDSISKAKSSDSKKQWKVVLIDEECFDDDCNYVILYI